MDRVLYFSSRYPAPLRETIIRRIIFSDASSAVVFSDAIFQGLTECGLDFINVNNPPIGHWPRMNKSLWTRTQHCVENGRDIWNVGGVNLVGYQQFSIFRNTYKTIRKVLRGEDATCLIYAINVPVIRAVLRYRNKVSPKTRIVLVIPDLIEDMYNGKTLKSKIQRWMHGDIDKLYQEMDGFVYLTEQMREKTKSNKPYCVVEGIYDSSNERYIQPDFSNKEKVVFYSGKLEQKFGARRLVDAFSMIPDDDLRLVLCGSGDSVDYIRRRAEKDSRICFLGQIPRERVIEIQAKARLLINPRTSEGEFTRYSFPSKNIQFLASGIPTLIYRLDGIPDEYYQYCLSIEDDYSRVEDLSQKMREAINMSDVECSRMGQSARTFVLEKKNARVQSQKIIDLVKQAQKL